MTTTNTKPGRSSHAEALRIARDYHEKLGWKFHPKQIGETAAEILNAMQSKLNDLQS